MYRLFERVAGREMVRRRRTDPTAQIEGSWHGNDTIWRTCLDLNRALLYADRQGGMQATPQREELSIVDAVVAGQGEGPLAPDPLPTGAVFAVRNPAVGDFLGAHLLDFDPGKIPLLRHACDDMRWPICAAARWRWSSSTCAASRCAAAWARHSRRSAPAWETARPGTTWCC